LVGKIRDVEKLGVKLQCLTEEREMTVGVSYCEDWEDQKLRA